jgi:hypothetical protein
MKTIRVHWCWPRLCITQQRLFGFVRKLTNGEQALKIDTTEQIGDIFTKGLSQPTFEYLWSKIIGW